MRKINTILVPVDFSEHAPKLLRAAVYVANQLGARLDILFVVESLHRYRGVAIPHISLEKMEQDLRAAAERRMASFLDENMDETVPHRAQVLQGEVAEQIVRHAAQNGSDLIIIATQGFRGLERTIFGSVAERVLKESPCPVLTINPLH
ncbi:MAG: universal stress protein [Thermodesulfobacteriota bacterium]